MRFLVVRVLSANRKIPSRSWAAGVDLWAILLKLALMGLAPILLHILIDVRFAVLPAPRNATHELSTRKPRDSCWACVVRLPVTQVTARILYLRYQS